MRFHFPEYGKSIWSRKRTERNICGGVSLWSAGSGGRMDDGAGIVLRCPIIPGLNDTEEHFRGIAEISQKLKGLKGVELMPYHKFGVAKDQRIGRGKQREYRVPTEEQKKEWEHRITKLGGRIFS